MEKRKKPVNYVSNKEMFAVLCKFQDDVKDNPDTPVPDKLALCFFRIAEGLASKYNFARYSYKDEMVLDGIEECYKRVHSFDREKSNNTFSYFTQVIYNAFIRRINEEQDEQYVKSKMILDYQLHEQLTNNHYIPGQNEVMIKAAEFVEKYEEAKRKKKASVQKPKGLDVIFTD